MSTHFTSAGPPDADWDDDALAGCRAWLAGWRQTHGEEGPPPADRELMTRVGRDAVELARQGVSRVELSRLMWAAGRDGVALDVAAELEAS